MDYKRIIKSKRLRLAILRALSFVPDKPMIKVQYWIKTGRRLNLKSPKRFTEKLQWYKLFYKNQDMVRCVDKAEVRNYITEKGMSYILNHCYGVYDCFDEIPWDELPEKFVIKDTLGMGGASVIVIKDKAKAEFDVIKKQIDSWVKEKHNIKSGGREWPYYSGNKHRIIIEKYIDSDIEKGGLIDYKFFCFDGVPKFLYVISDRIIGSKASFGIYDIDFNLLDVYRMDENKPTREIPKPENYEKMIEIASKLSEGFPEVRVDLYNVDGCIVFGELTFWDGSGYMKFAPDEFDYKLGELMKLRTT